jgi:hypothetical protein
MARYRVTGPDGANYEITAPDGASEQDVLRYAQTSIQAQPAKRTDPIADGAGQLVRGVNRGLNSLAALPGAIVGGAVDLAGGDGSKFRWDNPISEFMTSPNAQPETKLGRYADAAGRALGASAIPTAGLVAAAPGMAARAATSTAGAVRQSIGQNIAQAPGAAVAADAVAAVGSGVGAQAADEAGYGPATQVVAGLAGGLAPMAATAAAQRAIRPIRAAAANQGEAGAYGVVARDLGMPVDDFADMAAVGGTRGAAQTNRRAFDILGEEMVRAGGDVQRAQQGAIARIVQEQRVTPQTAAQQIRRLTQVHQNSPVMMGEYPSIAASDSAQRLRQPGNVDLDELGRVQSTQTQGKLDYLANNGNARSAQDVRNAIETRQEQMAPRMRETLQQIGPQQQVSQRTTRPMSIDDVSTQIEASNRLASQEYRAAYNGPINNRMSLQFLPRVLDGNLNRAALRAGEPRAAIERAVNQFFITTQGGQRLQMQTLQQLQDARAAVRGQITEYRRAGRDDLVNSVQPFYAQITQLMQRMSPQWARANARWADGHFAEVAQDLGDAFAGKAGPRFREQLGQFNVLAPEAQDIVRVHWVQQQLDKLDNLPDSNSVAKLFASDHARNTVRVMFGEDAAIQLTRAVRDNKVVEASQRMLGNSATHRRGVAQKQMDAETGLQAAVENANAQGVKSWLLERATQLLTERRNRPMADILTTPMSDTAQVSMHVQRMRDQQNRLNQINAPRRPQHPLMGIGGGLSTVGED